MHTCAHTHICTHTHLCLNHLYVLSSHICQEVVDIYCLFFLHSLQHAVQNNERSCATNASTAVHQHGWARLVELWPHTTYESDESSCKLWQTLRANQESGSERWWGGRTGGLQAVGGITGPGWRAGGARREIAKSKGCQTHKHTIYTARWEFDHVVAYYVKPWQQSVMRNFTFFDLHWSLQVSWPHSQQMAVPPHKTPAVWSQEGCMYHGHYQASTAHTCAVKHTRKHNQVLICTIIFWIPFHPLWFWSTWQQLRVYAPRSFSRNHQ